MSSTATPTAARSSRSTAGSAASTSPARSPRGAGTAPPVAPSARAAADDEAADDRPEQGADRDHEDQRRVAREDEVVDRDLVVVRHAEGDEHERHGDRGDRLGRDRALLLDRPLLGP